MQGIEKKILTRISKRGRGWAFSKVDFAADFPAGGIHQALSALAKSGQIRRALRGIYDYPRKSTVHKGLRSPDMDEIAHALARKFSWRIQPTGNVALNVLGLSTQVPGKWIYSSDGPSRGYKVGNQTIQFRKMTLKEAAIQGRESGLLVQAIKALGVERITEREIHKMRLAIKDKNQNQILRDTKSAPAWIHKIIHRICAVNNG